MPEHGDLRQPAEDGVVEIRWWWEGRNGKGEPVAVRRWGGWVDVLNRHGTSDPDGFALNPKYAREMAAALLAAADEAEGRSDG